MIPASRRALLELIDELVGDTTKPWKEKRDELLNLASESQRTSIEEFVAWFEPAE